MRVMTFYYLLLFLISIQLLLGLIFIYASSSVYALSMNSVAHYYLEKQIIGIALGIGLASIAARMPLSVIKKLSPFLFMLLLAITALTLFPGWASLIHGSRRWLNLGFVSFQPSEFLKMAFIIYLSYFLTKKQFVITSLQKTFIPLLCIIALPIVALLMQPDFGQALTLTITGLTLYFVALGSVRYVTFLLISSLPAIFLLIAIQPYRLQRIMTFINPWSDPQKSGFQIIQSLVAIGTGYLTGTGLGHSKQKFFYLPMLHTDFIFSIIAEETGLLGTTFLLFICFLIIIGGLKIASLLEDHFSMLVVIGFFTLIGLETVINIGVTTALLPTKGLGLPFVSYGKSSLIAHTAMLGIIYSLIKETT